MNDPPNHPKSRHVAKGHRKFLYLLVFFLLSSVVFLYNLKSIESLVKAWKTMKYDQGLDILLYSHYVWSNKSLQLPAIKNKSIAKSTGCHIPQLTPFPMSHQKVFQMTPGKINCEEKHDLLFKSTFQSSIIPAKEYHYFQKHNFASCCYRTVERDHNSSKPDEWEIVSSECLPLSFKKPTSIPEAHEFIAIYCKMKESNNTEAKPVDVHSFVHLKPRNVTSSSSSNDEKERKYNVVIFGMDSVSRMSFLRTMSQSDAFLKKEMEAVDMLGYNKVAENTFPNILPMLTSKTPEEQECTRKQNFDDCAYIWKEFSKEGFYTSFSEDATGSSAFNYIKPGFWKQPTDYYPRPLIRWADNYLIDDKGCFGPRLPFQFLLDHMEKFVQKMSEGNKNYFYFTWANLAHNNLYNGLVGDPHLLKTLKWLKVSGNLKDTIFILMSDHGYRHSSFAVQVQLEDRLPFLYFVLPESFKAKYKRAYKNLIGNRDKLITTFDIHQTLKDILHLKTIEEDRLINREAYLAGMGKILTRGISLFLPIPKFRTCTMAGIPLKYCSCNFLTVTNLNSTEVKNVTMVGLAYINAVLDGVVQCSQLQLSSVKMVQYTSNENFEAYLVNFETKPGGAQFEALVGRKMGETVGRQIFLQNKQGDHWSVQGKVDRTNSYHDKSRCVEGRQLKDYCHCISSNKRA